MRYISQVRYIAYAILKTKQKKQRPQASNIICTVKHRESDKSRWRKKVEAICVSPFGGRVRGRVGGGLAPMAGKFSYPFQLVFNYLLFFLIS